MSPTSLPADCRFIAIQGDFQAGQFTKKVYQVFTARRVAFFYTPRTAMIHFHRFLCKISCTILTSSICLAGESPSTIFLDPTQSLESRIKAMHGLNPREIHASAEQLITILSDATLLDPVRCFALTAIHSSSFPIRPEHQTRIDHIATSIVQNNQDGGNDLKLSILQWIYTRGTFGELKGVPTVSATALRNLLASDHPEIRIKAIRFIREQDLAFAKELEECLQGKTLGKVTTHEALAGLSRRERPARESHSDQHPPFNKEVLVPLLRHESFEVGALAAQQLARSDERGHYHAKLRPVLADPDTPTALRIAIMEAMTRSFAPANNFLHDYTLSLSQIIQDGTSTPELKQNALVQLHTLIKTHPPGTVQEIVTEPIYTLHLSYLKTDPEGILFDVVNREAVPKWAEYLEPIYHELVTTYPAYMAKHEARRLIAEQNKLEKQTALLHDKSQPASVRHQLFNTVGRHPEEAARFATDPENDEKMRTAAIERLLRVVVDTQQRLDPDLNRLAKVVQQVSGENGESAAKSRAIQFKEMIRKNYPATFSKVFSEAR